MESKAFVVYYYRYGCWFFFAKSEAIKQTAPQLVKEGESLVIKGVFFFIVFFTIGILNIKATGFINERKNYRYLKNLAILNCFTGILSLILGVFFFLELKKEETIEEFKKGVNPENKPSYHKDFFNKEL